ncbi:hypothetical protein SAY87_018686 [Trapa incisa]|uniref:non-specific serine/threonine protein kinase n=1 Tax=Trapa incisa TaxID=236973 RepID=A0AAN7Q5Y2_9MYRT|nr:hypothetical protein SAY87_018686 [Trapa incisa]
MNLGIKLVVLVLSTKVFRSWCLNFTYTTFYDSNIYDFNTNNSYIVKNAIQVTPDVSVDSISDMSGRIVYRKPLRLWRSGEESGTDGRAVANFTSTFVLNITPKDGPGGEGLAFVLAGDARLPNNSHGQWLGIVNSSTNGTARSPIVAVEFDTLKSYDGDVDGNHVGLDINSVYSVKHVSLTSYGVNLSAATDITARVHYDGLNISVFLHWSNDTTGEQTRIPIFSTPIDLSEYLPEDVFVGFSASTGNGTELNCIRAWTFESSDIIDGRKRSLLWVWILIPSLVLFLVVATLALSWMRLSRGRIEDSYPRIEDQIEGANMGPKKFRLGQIRRATGNFSPKNELGKGGFGTVYKGSLLGDHDVVAVKRISKNSRQGIPEFLAEVTTIGSLHHRNLVKLIGWCYERRELLLVYEYMPNSSLDNFIYQDKSSMPKNSTIHLDWNRRFNIISGVAQALDYLHNGCERRVLHRDIKASNIMLDSEFNARLGDFGLARMIRQAEQTHHSTKEIAGTPGYMAPETFLTGRATVETDVYAFGVLMLAIVCGRRPGERINDDSNIVYMVWDLHRQQRFGSAADPMLMDGPAEEVERVLLLGLACCHPNPNHRPSARTIWQVLRGEAPMPLVPLERPPFIWPAMPPSFKVDRDITLGDDQLSLITELEAR